MMVVAMGHGELSRFDTLQRVERGNLRVDDAAAVLSLGRRQVFRLLDRMRADGAEGLDRGDGALVGFEGANQQQPSWRGCCQPAGGSAGAAMLGRHAA